MKKKTEYEEYVSLVKTFRDKVKNKSKIDRTSELYTSMLNVVRPYLEKELEKEISVYETLLKTGLYNGFYDPWYSSGYYLNIEIRKIRYNKKMIETCFLEEDYPEIYKEIPETTRHPEDLIIGLKDFYHELATLHMQYYKNPKFSYIKSHIDAYIKVKYGERRKMYSSQNEETVIIRVNALNNIYQRVKEAGGINKVEKGNNAKLKLDIRFACSPVSKEYYERCMSLVAEIENVLCIPYVEDEYKLSFVEKIGQFALPNGQLSIFDYGLTA